jgi:Domain of unknown function (DUF6899)
MPYVTQDRREDIGNGANGTLDIIEAAKSAGDLNYAMTLLAKEYIEQHGLRYEHINTVMGVFASVQAEFYRRVAAPYEDTKIVANGDVY